MKHSDNILNKTEETIKEKNEIKKLEKKSLEQIISGHGYYEAEQKNLNKKGYINMLSLYNEIVKKLEHNLSSDDYMSIKNELFGQRFYMRNFEDEHKVNEDNDNVRPHRKKRKEDNFIDDNDIGERRYPFKKKSQAGIEQIEEYISKEDKEIVNADYPERLLERYSIDELKNLSQEIKEEVEWISEQKNYNDFINKKKKINTLLELYKKDFLKWQNQN